MAIQLCWIAGVVVAHPWPVIRKLYFANRCPMSSMTGSISGIESDTSGARASR